MCLGLAAGCARFGFEILDPAVDGSQVGAGVAGQGAGGDVGGGGGGGDVGLGGAAGTSGGGDGVSGAGGVVEAGAGGSAAAAGCTLSAPELLGDPNYTGNDLWSPSVSSDGLSLYFAV